MPKSTADSWTASPAWDIDRVPAFTVVVSFWEPAGMGVVDDHVRRPPRALGVAPARPGTATTPVVVLSLTAQRAI